MKKIKLTKGFTLIELLVVIAIIGILGAIVYAPFQTARRKGRDAQKIIEMKNIQAGLFLYADSHDGYYPEKLADLEAYQTEKLPRNANFTSTYEPNQYNYTSYRHPTTGKILGFHLFTHLETASPVLSGTAACVGSSNDNTASTSCLIAPEQPVIGTGSVDDLASNAKFLKAERDLPTGDNDKNCSTDTLACIYDLKS